MEDSIVANNKEETLAEAVKPHRAQHHQDLWDKIWRDEHGDIVIYQRPNALLIAWVVLTLASIFVPTGMPENIIWWLSLAVLAVWAALEIWKGVDYFRRALGTVVMILVLLAAFKLA